MTQVCWLMFFLGLPAVSGNIFVLQVWEVCIKYIENSYALGLG